MEILESIRQQLQRCAHELYGYTFFLFGSRAAKTARPRSDFDIGVIGPCALPLKTFAKLEDLFDAIATLYRIELVDMKRVSGTFKAEAMKTMEILHE